MWKRNKEGITEPHNQADPIDLVIISARKDNFCGQFIFPKKILLEKFIFSTNIKEGKRGFRVYPPWDKAENKQAKQTQTWQLDYFLDLSEIEKLDLNKLKKLYAIN